MKNYLEAGCIINKRGLKGELKVDCYCDTVEVFCTLDTLYLDDEGKKRVKVLSAKSYKGYAYIFLDGVCTPEAADELRGTVLYADRESIPVSEGGIFIEDLIGLSVIDADSGKEYGHITDVFNSGASDIYTVTKDGKDYYLPAVPEFIVSIDIEKSVRARPIPGIFDEAEQV